MLKSLYCMRFFGFWRNVMQSSSLFNPGSGTIVSGQATQNQGKQGRKRLVMEQGEEGKRKKWLSESALTKLSATGALMTVLGGGYSLDRSNAIDDALYGLQDKPTQPQIKQIQEYKTEMADGQNAMMFGMGIAGAAVGYSRGRDSRRKNQNSEPSR